MSFIYLFNVFVDGNDFSGTIPSEIMRLKELSVLVLGKVANSNDVSHRLLQYSFTPYF